MHPPAGFTLISAPRQQTLYLPMTSFCCVWVAACLTRSADARARLSARHISSAPTREWLRPLRVAGSATPALQAAFLAGPLEWQVLRRLGPGSARRSQTASLRRFVSTGGASVIGKRSILAALSGLSPLLRRSVAVPDRPAVPHGSAPMGSAGAAAPLRCRWFGSALELVQRLAPPVGGRTRRRQSSENVCARRVAAAPALCRRLHL